MLGLGLGLGYGLGGRLRVRVRLGVRFRVFIKPIPLSRYHLARIGILLGVQPWRSVYTLG